MVQLRKGQNILWLVLAGVVVIILLPVLKLLYQAILRLAGLAGSIPGEVGAQLVMSKYSTYPPNDLANLKKSAEYIHKAYHSGWDEDEDTAVRHLNVCNTKTQVVILCDFYKAMFSRSLKEDSIKHLTDGISAIGMGSSFDLARVKGIVKENWF